MSVKKLAILFAVTAMLFGNLQALCAKDYTSIRIPIHHKDYTPVKIFIPKTKGDEKLDLKPQPGYDVTLLPNQKVHFAWSDNTSKIFVIKDSNGESVFEKVIDGENGIDLVPIESNLKAGQKYFWSVDDNSKPYEIEIFDERIETDLLAELAKIDAESLSREEGVLEKAEYLLMLSDEHSETFDFYWLIAQLLSEISPTDKELAEKKNELLIRCSMHLDDEMP